MGIDIIPSETISVPDGVQNGTIKKVEKVQRGPNNEYTYIDVHVTVDGLNRNDGSPVTIKDGMSDFLSKNSKLGKTCMRFGLSEENMDKATKEKIPVDITKFITEGKRVTYIVMNETKNGKTYARVVDSSLKPLEQEPQAQETKKESPQGDPAPSKIDEAFDEYIVE